MKKKYITVLILSIFVASNSLIIHSAAQEDTLFRIHLMINDSWASRVAFCEAFIPHIENLNIEVIKHLEGLIEIGSRTWAHPRPIPPHEDGGFDAVVAGMAWYPESEHYDYFYGSDNFQQYNNSDFFSLIDQFEIEQNQIQRRDYSHQLQSYLYNDLPVISLYSDLAIMPTRDNIQGINSLQIFDGSQRTEYWEDTNDDILIISMWAFGDVTNSFRLNTFDHSEMFDSYNKIAYGTGAMLWLQPLYGRLFQRNPTNFFWEPVIASDYSISTDKRNVTVDIDPNAKFSDGSPVLAEDVKYTYELHMTPETNSHYYSDLVGAFMNGSSIEIIDSYTIKFSYLYVHQSPLSLLSLGILDKSYVEPEIAAHGYSIFDEAPFEGNVNDTLVRSCGPFMLDTFNNAEGTATLLANPYWNNLTASGGNNAKLDQIQFIRGDQLVNDRLQLKAGNIDMINPTYYIENKIVNGAPDEFDVELLNGMENIHCELLPIRITHELSLNLKHPIFGTGELTPEGTSEAALNIRKALSHAIPRQAIIDDLFTGSAYPAATAVPPSNFDFNSNLDPHDYDLELAKDYLEMAGYNLDKTSFAGITLLMIFGLLGLSIIIRLRRI